MPDFQITAPDGTQYKVTAPEGAGQDEVLSYAKQHFESSAPTPNAEPAEYKGPGGFTKIPELFGRGMTLGLSDYAGAGANYLGDKTAHALGIHPERPSMSYEQELQAIRAENQGYREASPVAAYGSELAGGVTSPIFAGIGEGVDAGLKGASKVLNRIMPRYVGYGAQGAVAGAAAGAGNAENAQGGIPSLGDVGRGAGMGAEFGGALGVALPAGMEGARWLGGKVTDAAQAGLDRLPGAQESAAGRRLYRAADRDSLSADDIRSMVDKMGPDATIADVGGNVRGLAENAAQQPGVSLKAAEQLGQRQYGQAESIKAAALKAAGAAHTDELIARRAVNTAPLYEDSFAPNGGPFAQAQKGKGVTSTSYQIDDPLIDDILAQPESQTGLREGMESIRRDNLILRDRDPDATPASHLDYALKRNPETGQWERVGKPNLRLIDATKRGYDIMLESDTPDMVHPRTGTPTNKARQIAAFRDILINRTEAQLPIDPRFGTSTWAAARNQWGQMSKPIEALNTIDKVLDKARDASDVTGRLYGSPAARAKLQGLTQDPQAMSEFEGTLQNWKTFAETNRQVTGNSRTAYRNAAQEDNSSDLPGIAANVAQGKFGAGVAGALRALGKLLTQPSSGVSDQLAPMFTNDRTAQDALLNMMRQRATARALNTQRLMPFATSAPGPLSGMLSTGGSNQ